MQLFSYDDITLVPKHSSLVSRSEADTSINFCGYKFGLPVIPANMTDVISFENARELSTNGYFYIMHRFNNATQMFSEYVIENKIQSGAISVGVTENSKRELEYASQRMPINFICIDVAHGFHENVKHMIKHIQSRYVSQIPKIIAGNVATADGYKFLCDLGVDAVKVGIGGGSICITRYKTGFHIPTAYAVWDCATNGGRDVPIIADGGAKHFGDIAKALVLGADMVMSGKWFAECIDSPARIEHGKKIYRGSTSYEAKGTNNHIEGQTLEIERACTYSERLVEIQQAIQSSISYAGGIDLSAFNSVEWFLCH